MSFHEKSLWLLFVSLIGIFGCYFAVVLPAKAVDVQPGQIGLFAVLVVLLVLIQIVGAILLAIVGKLSGSMDGTHDTDERDKLIGLKSTRNGSYILAVGVCMSLCAALVTQGNFVFMNLLLGFWVLAQLVEIGSQLVQYRRGA